MWVMFINTILKTETFKKYLLTHLKVSYYVYINIIFMRTNYMTPKFKNLERMAVLHFCKSLMFALTEDS